MKRYFFIGLLLMGCHKSTPGHPAVDVGTVTSSKGYTIPTQGNLIIVAMGQSNMLGSGQAIEFPANDRVFVSGAVISRRGPGYTFASSLADSNPNIRVFLVECAHGSTPIDAWIPGGDHFQECIDYVNATKEESKGTIVGILFYQGETGARDWLDTTWPDKFMGLIPAYRKAFGDSCLPVIWAQLGKLGESIPNESPTALNWVQFKANQLTVHLSDYSAMIKTEDQPVIDDVHHDGPANEVIGQRMYMAFLSLLSD